MYGEIHRYTLHCTSRHACIPGEHALIGACRSTASAISALLHYTQDGLSPDTPNRVSRGRMPPYAHTAACTKYLTTQYHHNMLCKISRAACTESWGGDYCIIPYLGPYGDLPPEGSPPVAQRGVQQGYCLLGGQGHPPGTPGTLLGPRTWCMISRGACTKVTRFFLLKVRHRFV